MFSYKAAEVILLNRCQKFSSNVSLFKPLSNLLSHLIHSYTGPIIFRNCIRCWVDRNEENTQNSCLYGAYNLMVTRDIKCTIAIVLMCYEGKELNGIYWDIKKSFFDI